jgi:hypothetical protein
MKLEKHKCMHVSRNRAIWQAFCGTGHNANKNQEEYVVTHTMPHHAHMEFKGMDGWDLLVLA